MGYAAIVGNNALATMLYLCYGWDDRMRERERESEGGFLFLELQLSSFLEWMGLSCCSAATFNWRETS